MCPLVSIFTQKSSVETAACDFSGRLRKLNHPSYLASHRVGTLAVPRHRGVFPELESFVRTVAIFAATAAFLGWMVTATAQSPTPPSPSPSPSPGPAPGPAPAPVYAMDTDGGNNPGVAGCVVSTDDATCTLEGMNPKLLRDTCHPTDANTVIEAIGPSTCTQGADGFTQDVSCPMYCKGIGQTGGTCATTTVAACDGTTSIGYCTCTPSP